jgi:allantoicase
MCSLQAAYLSDNTSSKTIINKSRKWKLLLNKVKLYAHKKHNFRNKLMSKNKINYIKINIYPDGGISRLKVFGAVE